MLEDDFVNAVRATFTGFRGDITRDTVAAEVPGWDSFGHVQLIFELEDVFGVHIDPMQALNCENVGALHDFIQELRREQ